jgi:hypothetical protein
VLVSVVLSRLETWAPPWNTIRNLESFPASVALGLHATAVALAAYFRRTMDYNSSEWEGDRLYVTGIALGIFAGGFAFTAAIQIPLEKWIISQLNTWLHERGKCIGIVVHVRSNLFRTAAMIDTLGTAIHFLVSFRERDLHADVNWNWMMWPLVFCAPTSVMVTGAAYAIKSWP